MKTTRRNTGIFLCCLAVVTAVAILPARADLVWTGAGDAVSLFQEGNWLDDNNAVPAANTINANTAVTADTGGLIRIDSGSGSPGNFGGNFDIGSGNDLFVGGGKVLATTTSGIRVNGADAGVGPLRNFTITGAGTEVRAQFILEMAISLEAGALLRFGGSGNPVNECTIDITSPLSVLQFSSETWTTFQAEHLAKVSFNAAALVFGSDPFTLETGDNALASDYNAGAGVQINVIPEPASLGLFVGIGIVLLNVRRRR